LGSFNTKKTNDNSYMGYVYIATNPDLQGVKIGYSLSDPNKRIKDFDTAALPKKYQLEYFIYVANNAQKIEQLAHGKLKNSGHWIKADKGAGQEWFSCSVEQAVILIEDIAGKHAEKTIHTEYLALDRRMVEAERLQKEKERQERERQEQERLKQEREYIADTLRKKEEALMAIKAEEAKKLEVEQQNKIETESKQDEEEKFYKKQEVVSGRVEEAKRLLNKKYMLWEETSKRGKGRLFSWLILLVSLFGLFVSISAHKEFGYSDHGVIFFTGILLLHVLWKMLAMLLFPVKKVDKYSEDEHNREIQLVESGSMVVCGDCFSVWERVDKYSELPVVCAKCGRLINY